MKEYKAIIYDIDGTLLNTVKQNMYPLIQIIKEELDEDWTFEQVVPFTAQPGMKTIADLGIRDVEGVYERWVRYVNSYGLDAIPFDGIPELLEHVRKRGIKQGVASSKRRKQYGIDMVPYGFDKFMEAAVLFEDTQIHKPDPTPLLECLHRMDVAAADALYVGDARADMEAARAAGMDFAYASWGSYFPMDRSEPDYYPDHPTDLIKFL